MMARTDASFAASVNRAIVCFSSLPEIALPKVI